MIKKILDYDIDNKIIKLNDSFNEFILKNTNINFITIINLSDGGILNSVIEKIIKNRIDINFETPECLLIDYNIFSKYHHTNNYLIVYVNFGINKWLDKIIFSLLYFISSLFIFNTKNKITDEDLFKLEPFLKIKKYLNLNDNLYFNFKCDFIWNIFDFEDIFDNNFNLMQSKIYLNTVLNKNSFNIKINEIKSFLSKIFNEKLCYEIDNKNVFYNNSLEIENCIWSLKTKIIGNIEITNIFYIFIFQYFINEYNNKNKINLNDLVSNLKYAEIEYKFKLTILNYKEEVNKVMENIEPKNIYEHLKVLRKIKDKSILLFNFKPNNQILKAKTTELIKKFNLKDNKIIDYIESNNQIFNDILFEETVNKFKNISNFKNKNNNNKIFDKFLEIFLYFIKNYKINSNNSDFFFKFKDLNKMVYKYFNEIRTKNNTYRMSIASNIHDKNLVKRQHDLNVQKLEEIKTDKNNKLKRLELKYLEVSNKINKFIKSKNTLNNDIKNLEISIDAQKAKMKSYIDQIQDQEKINK